MSTSATTIQDNDSRESWQTEEFNWILKKLDHFEGDFSLDWNDLAFWDLNVVSWPDWIDFSDLCRHVLVEVEPVDDGVQLEHDVVLRAPVPNLTKNRQLVFPVLKFVDRDWNLHLRQKLLFNLHIFYKDCSHDPLIYEIKIHSFKELYFNLLLCFFQETITQILVQIRNLDT